MDITEKIKGSILAYKKVGLGILRQENIEIQDRTLGIKGYAKYILREGSNQEKANFISGLHFLLVLKNGQIEIFN